MEWRKVSKNTIVLLISIFFIQSFFFLYSLNIKEERSHIFGAEPYIQYNDEYKEKNKQYVEGYHKSIVDIIERAESMGGISIFATQDSFSQSNLEQTKKDFENMLDIQPTTFNDVFLKHYFDFDYINLFVAIGCVFIALSMVDNKRLGLRSILHSSYNGRVRLVLNKLFAMLKWDTIIVLIFYIGNLIISAFKFEGNILGCLCFPIQSVSYFSKFPYEMNIGYFLLLYLLFKIFLAFIVSLIAWLIMYCIDNTIISIGVIGLICATMYIVDRVIGTNSPINHIKFCNIWYLFKDISVFTEYKNLNWFENAVNKNIFIYFSLASISVVCIAIGLIVGIKRYPCSSRTKNNNSILRFISKIKRFVISLPEKLSVGMLELYKIFIKQKGIIVVVLLVGLWINQIDLEQIKRTKDQDLYYDFMEKYEGVKDEKSEKYISDLENMLSDLDLQYELLSAEYEAGRLTSDEWFNWNSMYINFESERIFLKQIKEQSDYLSNLKNDKDIEGWYVNIYGYNHLFATNDSYGNMALIFSIILICSGLFAVEKKSGTEKIIRGSSEGRFKLFYIKLKIVVISTFFMFVIGTVIEILTIDKVYGLSGWNAPVQSIHMLSFVPFECSVGTFVFILYLAKLFVLICLTVFVSSISIWLEQKKTIFASFILCVPSLLGLVGFSGFENYSIISVMSIGPMMIRLGSIFIMLSVIGVIGAIGVISLLSGYRKWCNT